MSEKATNLSEYIAENFGANASYVEGLLNRYQTDPNLVDESWRTFFSELLNGGSPMESGNGQSAGQTPVPTERVSAEKSNDAATRTETAKTAQTPIAKAQPGVSIGEGIEVKALVGASKKIVENMELSLTVPTATSVLSLIHI